MTSTANRNKIDDKPSCWSHTQHCCGDGAIGDAISEKGGPAEKYACCWCGVTPASPSAVLVVRGMIRRPHRTQQKTKVSNMLFYQLFGIGLLVAPWHPAVAFRPHVALPQQRSGSSGNTYDSSSSGSSSDTSGGQRKHPAVVVAAASTSVTTPTDPSPPTRGSIPRRQGSVGSGPTAAVRSVATHLAHHRSSSNTAAAVDATRNEQCGASSPSSAVTRSQVLSSMAAAAAGLVLAPPREASAVESTAGAAPETQDLVSSSGGSAEEGAAAKYMVGSDEVCTLHYLPTDVMHCFYACGNLSIERPLL